MKIRPCRPADSTHGARLDSQETA